MLLGFPEPAVLQATLYDLQTHQSIVWQPESISVPAEMPEQPDVPAQPVSEEAQAAATEAEKRQARSAKFGTTITQVQSVICLQVSGHDRHNSLKQCCCNTTAGCNTVIHAHS